MLSGKYHGAVKSIKEEPIRIAYGWIVYSPAVDGIIQTTLRPTRKESIQAWLHKDTYVEADWKHWYNIGYRLVKVRVVAM